MNILVNGGGGHKTFIYILKKHITLRKVSTFNLFSIACIIRFTNSLVNTLSGTPCVLHCVRHLCVCDGIVIVAGVGAEAGAAGESQGVAPRAAPGVHQAGAHQAEAVP